MYHDEDDDDDDVDDDDDDDDFFGCLVCFFFLCVRFGLVGFNHLAFLFSKVRKHFYGGSRNGVIVPLNHPFKN